MNLSRLWYFFSVLGMFLLAAPGQVSAQQDLSKSLKYLQKADLISKERFAVLRERISGGQIENALDLADEMAALELQSLLGDRYRPEMLDGEGLAGSGIDSLVRPSSKSALLSGVDACAKAALLSPKGRELLRKRVDQGYIRDRLDLLLELRSELIYREATSPLKLQGLAQQLRANGMVAHPEDGKLIRFIDDGQLTDPFEMLDYCQNARRFEAADYAGSPGSTIETIFAQTAALLPDLAFSDFAWEIVPDPEASGGSGAQTLLVSLRIGEHTYWQADPLGAAQPSPGTFAGRLNPETYYKIFNLALSEQGSLYRLHHVSCNLDEVRGWDPQARFGIIALRESQPEAFRYLGSYYRFSKEDFRNALSRELVAGVIERYYSFGMFSRLTLTEYRKSREYALSNPRLSYEEVLDCFPGVFLDIKEAGITDYPSLLKGMADISRGIFHPDNMVSEERFSFEFGGDVWSARLRPFETGPDPAFFALIDQAAATLPEGRFYEVGEGGKYIFLNTEQWDLLHRQRVVGKQK